MRLVITSKGPSLEDDIDARFGRCKYFVFVDSESLELESVLNCAAWVSSGAGAPAAFLVSNRGAEAVLTGQVGPQAAQILSDAGIPVYCGISRSLRHALDDFNQGKLQRATGSTVEPGFGMEERTP